MAKEIAKKETALAAMIGDDAGFGMEGADRDSYAIPFLRVIQKTSGQVDETDASYIEAAKAGMLINTVTSKLYNGKDGVIFLPCAFQRRFIQWSPLASGGGIKGEFTPEEVNKMRADGLIEEVEGRLMIEGDTLRDTRSHYGLVVEETGEVSQVILALSSTQIKKSKQLMSMLSAARVRTDAGLVTPPTWMNKIKLTTVAESNDQGSWYGVRFEGDGFIDDQDLYAAGKAFYETVSSGKARAAYEAEREGF